MVFPGQISPLYFVNYYMYQKNLSTLDHYQLNKHWSSLHSQIYKLIQKMGCVGFIKQGMIEIQIYCFFYMGIRWYLYEMEQDLKSVIQYIFQIYKLTKQRVNSPLPINRPPLLMVTDGAEG